MALANIDVKASTNEYRPCRVNYNGEEKQGLFHRWIEKEDLLIKFDSEQEKMGLGFLQGIKSDWIDGNHIIPQCSVTEKIANTLALVEFMDGTIGEVEPTNVRFLDNEEKFEEHGVFRKFPDSETAFAKDCDSCLYEYRQIVDEPCINCRKNWKPKED